ncbi:MAG: type restriction enzyme protein [Thermodesulfobacteriota bacterium]|nr:type restriction enzyme protein [Thermodesulfobacteriota bacterium]
MVRLIVRIIEPYHGRIYDPACGSGGMFVQSARFVGEHKSSSSNVLSVYGQERVAETVRLSKMNLAVHGLGGDIRQGNTYYEDLHASTAEGGKLDFVMANPPFNVDRVDKDRLKDDPRFPYGLPRVDNANYLWIQIFYSALNKTGRAGFVMANSASDARGSELEIRKKLIQDKAVDVMVAVGSNFFYTVTLPCTLWFLDKAKAELMPSPPSPQTPLPEDEGLRQPSPQTPLPEGEGLHYRGGFDFSGLVDRARELRKSQTPAEEVFWQLVRSRQFMGLKFRRQHQIGDYIVDFYYADHKLIVELDGPVHDDPDRKRVDHKRDAYLTSLGNKVLRFRNQAFLENPQQILCQIADSLPSRPDPTATFDSKNKPHLPPSPAGRGAGGEGTAFQYADTVLFIDAREIYQQVDRAHREFTPEQVEFLGNIARLYRGKEPENLHGSAHLMAEKFPDGIYRDIPGLCKVATIQEIEAQGWSLNPGRYVGVADRKEDDFDFYDRLEALNDELETLNAEAQGLEGRIAENVAKLLEGR